jgi:hypothetical protein
MKKITFALAVFSAVCLNGFSQTKVDLGWDWNGTAAVAPVSGTYIEGATHNSTPPPFTVYAGTENELLVSSTGADVLYKLWAGDLYAAGETYGCLQIGRLLYTNYIEVSLTTNSAGKKISAAKLNGTSSSLDVGTTFVVLYSDAAPFDEQRVVGYNDTYAFPASRSGGAGVTLEVPAGCKSFRIYRKVYIEQTSVNPVLYAVDEWGSIVLSTEDSGSINTRFGYFSVTLNDNASGIHSITNAGKAIISTEYFDIMGKKVPNNFKGLVLVKTTYDDGTSYVEKSFHK